MNIKSAIKQIEKELTDLDVPKGSDAWKLIFENATGASEVMTKAELKAYIQDYVESLPSHLFFE